MFNNSGKGFKRVGSIKNAPCPVMFFYLVFSLHTNQQEPKINMPDFHLIHLNDIISGFLMDCMQFHLVFCFSTR